MFPVDQVSSKENTFALIDLKIVLLDLIKYEFGSLIEF